MILARLSTGWDIEPRERTEPSPMTVSAEPSRMDIGAGGVAASPAPPVAASMPCNLR